MTQDTAWLIEHTHDPRYGRESWYSGKDGFTIDSLQAVRFARKEDALREIDRFPTTLAKNLIAAHHAWIPARVCPHGHLARQCEICEAQQEAAHWRPLADFSTELLEGMQQVERPVVSSGLPRLDFLLGGGFMGGKLYVLAAPPGAGKTTLAAQLADEAASQGVPVLFVALEMSRGELFDRAIARAAGVDSSLLESRRLAAHPDMEERVADALDRYMGETAQHLAVEEGDYSTTPARLLAWARQARARYGLTEEQPVLVVVDYLQLLYTGNADVDTQPGEVARVSEVAVLLKRLARDGNAAVLALSDVNREEQKAATKLQEITLSALRGSNRIGHAADTVLALYSEQGQDTGGKARNDPWDALAARLKDNPRATTFLRELDTAKANVLPGGGRGAQVFAVLELLKNRGGRGKGSLPLFYQRAFHRLLPGPTAGLDEIEGRGGGRS